METMNFREKKRKSLKGPIFGITTFLVVGTGIVTYAMVNEKEPIIIGNSGSLLTGNIPIVVEENALTALSENDIANMYEIKINYNSDTTNSKIKSNLSIPFVYVDGEELTDFNSEINTKFTTAYNSFKDTMQNVEHNFTYKVNYESFHNIVKNKVVLSIIITESMIDDSSSIESMSKKYTYNIDLLTGKVLKQTDIIVDMLGSNYKDAIKIALSTYLDENNMISKEDYKYAYTGLENFYIKEGMLHFIFNSGDLADKSFGILDIEIEKLQNSISSEIAIY